MENSTRTIDDSVITYDEIGDMPHTLSIDSIDKKATYKKEYYILHAFLMVTMCMLLLITLLLTVTTFKC